MLDVLVQLLPLVTALLGASLLTLTCCGPPVSLRDSVDQDDGMMTGIENTTGRSHHTGRSRGLKTVYAENINHDVRVRKSKEKTLEEEERKELRKRREMKQKSQASRGREGKKSNQRVGQNQEKAKKRRTTVAKDKDNSNTNSGKKSKSEAREKDEKRKERKERRDRKKSEDNEKNRPVSSSDATPTSKVAEGKQESVDKPSKDADDDSQKQTLPGANTFVQDEDSRKGVRTGMERDDSVATAGTMFSRERADEIESAKLKRDAQSRSRESPHTRTALGQSSETPINSGYKRTSPKPKRKLSKKKEEEVRIWNERIRLGCVFRERKDDETIDEVNVDWNS